MEETKQLTDFERLLEGLDNLPEDNYEDYTFDDASVYPNEDDMLYELSMTPLELIDALADFESMSEFFDSELFDALGSTNYADFLSEKELVPRLMDDLKEFFNRVKRDHVRFSEQVLSAQPIINTDDTDDFI